MSELIPTSPDVSDVASLDIEGVAEGNYCLDMKCIHKYVSICVY